MSNVQPVTKCPKCDAAGKQVKDYGRLVHYKCPECDYEWTTLVIKGRCNK